MTRINIIPPDELMDQHLIAEYREFPMVPASLNRTLSSKAGLIKSKIKNRYTLNTGHVYFFYDKGKYLEKRYGELITEMKARGFKPDFRRKFATKIFKENGLYNDWSPSLDEQNIARERIAKRISEKPGWYRKTMNLMGSSATG